MTSVPPVVDAAWVLARRASGRVVLADVRWYLDGRDGRQAYEAGHIADAVFVDLDRDLSRTDLDPREGRHPLPGPDAFAQAMGLLGIGDDTLVIGYDDTGGLTAGRLVWMLRTLGRDAAVLDGGLAAWPEPLAVGPPPSREPARFTATPWPTGATATADEVAWLAGSGEAVVLDARAGERYRGEMALLGERPGHIPGARSAPWADNLDPATGRFLPADALRRRYEALGVGDRPAVASCGSGVSACIDLLAIERAGLGTGRLFVASWSGWSADPERPAAAGATPDGL